MLNKRENTSMAPREDEWKSEPTRLDISVERPKTDNGQDSQDIDFSITKLDGKTYDRNETIANSVRTLCKCYFEEFNLDLELLEHLQKSFKCFINDTQCVVCKRYFRGNHKLNQRLIRSNCESILLKQGPNAALPDHCLPNKGSNPVLQTGQDNHHNTLSRNGKEKKRANLGKWNKTDPIRWPRMNDQVKWNASKILSICSYQNIDQYRKR